MQLHHQATDPPVLGVQVEPFADAATAGRGFVVFLIPASEFRPHRAEHVTNKPYYIRAGDDFVVPPVSLLRAMFHPRSNPYLRVQASFHDMTKTNDVVRWIFTIQNSDTATARDVCL